MQVRYRLLTESLRRPEIFSCLEITPPVEKHKKVIGAEDWDLKWGLGVIRGFSWGTMTLGTTVEYTREDSSLNLGETAVEYLRRLSRDWRVYAGVEGGEGGGPDEWVLTTGIQWRLSKAAELRFNNAVGVSSKATDWAPEIGALFSWPTK